MARSRNISRKTDISCEWTGGPSAESQFQSRCRPNPWLPVCHRQEGRSTQARPNGDRHRMPTPLAGNALDVVDSAEAPAARLIAPADALAAANATANSSRKIGLPL